MHPLWDMTDTELGMDQRSPIGELRTLLDGIPVEGLERTRQAMDDGRLIRHEYAPAPDRGCLLFHLVGVRSKAELLNYCFGSEEAWWAARRVVRWFDYGRLSEGVIRRLLNEAIAQRAEIHQAELTCALRTRTG